MGGVACVREVLVVVLRVLQVVLHLVAAGDVALVLDLQLHQQVLIADPREQLWLATEVVAVTWKVLLYNCSVQKNHSPSSSSISSSLYGTSRENVTPLTLLFWLRVSASLMLSGSLRRERCVDESLTDVQTNVPP